VTHASSSAKRPPPAAKRKLRRRRAHLCALRRFPLAGEWLEDRRVLTATLTGAVWHDLNANGLREAGEPGVAGAVVEVMRAIDGVVGNADDVSLGYRITDASGSYRFENLSLGNGDHLVVRPPIGMQFTAQNAGDESADSDVDSAGVAPLPPSGAEPIDLNFDAGLTGALLDFGFAFNLGNDADGGFVTDDYIHHVAIAADGNAVVSGGFFGMVDFDPGPGVVHRTSAGGRDIFLAKFTPGGALVWLRTFGGPGDDIAFKNIAFDGEGKIHITGGFSETADFDPGPGTWLLTSSGGIDMFFARLDSEGNLEWARALSGPDPDLVELPQGLAVTAEGDIFLAGVFQGPVDFDPGPGEQFLTPPTEKYDAFVARYDAKGELVWVRQIGGDEWDSAISIKLDGHGGLWVTGYFQGTIDFDPGPGAHELTANGAQLDAFVLKLSTDGDFVWAGRIGGPEQDVGHYLTIDHSGNVILVGTYRVSADLDPGPDEFLVTGVVTEDVYIVKLDAAGQFLWGRTIAGTFRDRPYEVAVDADNNIYTVGAFYNTVDFDPGPGEFLLSSSGAFDFFLSKLDPSGNFVDARQLGNATTDDFGFGVTIDAHGNIYAAGEFGGTADFDTGPGFFPLTSQGGHDAFLLQILQPTLTGQVWLDENQNGLRDLGEAAVAGAVAEVFASQDAVIGNDDDVSRGVAITDDQGRYQLQGLTPGVNYYVVFRPPAGLAFTSQDAGDDALDSDANSLGVTDLFSFDTGRSQIALDAGLTGEQQDFGWAFGAEGSGAELGRDIAVAGDGSLFVLGTFSGPTIDLDPGPGTVILNSAGAEDVLVAKYTAAGALAWARALGGSGPDTGTSLSTDSDGNVFVTGSFQGTADFDPGPETFLLTALGDDDGFVVKLDRRGHLAWARQVAGSGPDRINDVQVTDAGHVLIAGELSGLDGMPAPQDPRIVLTSDDGGGFLARLDHAGLLTWSYVTEGSGTALPQALALDGAGDVLVTGSFSGTVDFAAGPASLLLTSQGDQDVFVARFDPSGELAWATSFGGPQEDRAWDVAVDSSGNATIAGEFRGQADLNPGAGAFLATSAGQQDAFLVKLDAAGGFVLARVFGGAGTDAARCVVIGEDDTVYVAGEFAGTVDFNPSAAVESIASSGGQDAFLVRLDAAGNLVYARAFGGPGEEQLHGLAVDQQRNVFLTGSFAGDLGPADFDPGPGSFLLSESEPVGQGDLFVSRLNFAEIVVTNTSDTGAGSLREALRIANTNPGPDAIRFNIPIDDPGFAAATQSWTIQPLSALPAITDTVTLDGATQPGWAGSPVISLDGSLAGSANGLVLEAGGNVINALNIQQFSAHGVLITSEGNRLTGNYVGTDVTGTLDRGNGAIGVRIDGGDGNIIGGVEPGARNVISGNGIYGVGVRRASFNVIQGNYLGTDATGQFAIGNLAGIGLSHASDNLLGGTAAGAGNLISGNIHFGIGMGDDGRTADAEASTHNVIQGNRIGVTASGAAALGNTYAGIYVHGSFNTIGGGEPGAGNLISGTLLVSLNPDDRRNGSGIILDAGAHDNVIQGNRIGTDAAGNVAVPNAGHGIAVYFAEAMIGGEGPGAGNLISGNTKDGVAIYGNLTPNGVAGLWRADGNAFEETLFTTGDLLGAGFAPGVASQAFSFDGVDDAYRDPGNFIGANRRLIYNARQVGSSMEAWIKTSDSEGTIITDGGGIDTATGHGTVRRSRAPGGPRLQRDGRRIQLLAYRSGDQRRSVSSHRGHLDRRHGRRRRELVCRWFPRRAGNRPGGDHRRQHAAALRRPYHASAPVPQRLAGRGGPLQLRPLRRADRRDSRTRRRRENGRNDDHCRQPDRRQQRWNGHFGQPERSHARLVVEQHDRRFNARRGQCDLGEPPARRPDHGTRLGGEHRRRKLRRRQRRGNRRRAQRRKRNPLGRRGEWKPHRHERRRGRRRGRAQHHLRQRRRRRRD
jgi:hypothetical protein